MLHRKQDLLHTIELIHKNLIARAHLIHSLLPVDKSGSGLRPLPHTTGFLGKKLLHAQITRDYIMRCISLGVCSYSFPLQTRSALSCIPELNQVCEVNALTSP